MVNNVSRVTRKARKRSDIRDEEGGKHIKAGTRPTPPCSAASSLRENTAGAGRRAGSGGMRERSHGSARGHGGAGSPAPRPLRRRDAPPPHRPPSHPVPDQPTQTQPSRHHLGQRRDAFPPELAVACWAGAGPAAHCLALIGCCGR